MRTIDEIRLSNVRGVLANFCEGKQKILAQKTGLNPNTISRWLGGNENRATISDKNARLIEGVFGLECGYMDNIHTNVYADLDKKKLREYFSDYAAIAEASPKHVDPLIVFDAAFARWEAEKSDSESNVMDIFINLHTGKNNQTS